MVCCHYLDIAFFFDIYKSLEIGQGLGYYIRQLNLLQNRNPDNYLNTPVGLKKLKA